MAQSRLTVDCVWVLSGSPEPHLPSTFDWITPPDRVVAADAGAALAERLDLTPNILLGDFDSIDPRLLARYTAQALEIRSYKHETKQETDTELAVLAALEWQPGCVYIFGALGGRLDHALANVLMLAQPALAGTDVRIVDGNQELYLARAGRENLIRGRAGDTVSVLPVGGEARSVRNEGLQYPLHGEELLLGSTRGVSNMLLGSEARLWLDGGELLVIVTHTQQRG